MSGRIRTRRIGQSALSSLNAPSSSNHWRPCASTSTPSIVPTTTSRHLSLNPFKKDPAAPSPKQLQNPVLVEALKTRQARLARKDNVPRPEIQYGKLAGTSIFDPLREIRGYKDDMTPEQRDAVKARDEARQKRKAIEKEMSISALRLDPEPLGRKTLERELVIKGIRRRGRLTKDQYLKRTERQLTFTSQQLPTSTKKLTKLMNMIAGKTVEEALVQLRFSKKKVARDVLKGLLVAQDTAVVSRGMGLNGLRERKKLIEGPEMVEAAEASLSQDGEVEITTDKDNIAGVQKADTQEKKPWADETDPEKKEALEKQEKAREAAKLALLYPDGTRKLPKTGEPTTILLKDGSRKQIHDSSEIYVDQAWVGKSTTLKSWEPRARGRMNRLLHRTSKFSVLLKEEKTRIRISEELQKKKDNRKVWVALPDRPVTSQRQYCLW
ncbi:hypothetical protein K491DRAFT_716517 [Lophiostoma macrostomum CBS 122681]|uniref:Ribosomal protein L22 n=1 Tax=Lophiostoma macrostomum CBS 122681 TaxID=1314788 RepID=A0A6A6T880_9PLEO|nr:hypothetical protein K491DRAFT_716517 [Lophiostoma macrostomum CBS 122681]